MQDFQSLLPTFKSREPQRDMQKGVIVLIMYATKSSGEEFRLGRVVKVEIE